MINIFVLYRKNVLKVKETSELQIQKLRRSDLEIDLGTTQCPNLCKISFSKQASELSPGFLTKDQC
jgi:hypothetical protein